MNEEIRFNKKLSKIINITSSASAITGDEIEIRSDIDQSSVLMIPEEKKEGTPFLKHALAAIDPDTKGTLLRAMAIFTIIELYGSFITGKTGKDNTQNNFLTFCTSKYIAEEYRKVSKLLYKIFRNGVMHSYIAKGAAFLSSQNTEESAIYHLQFFDKGLWIYVPKFAEDVSRAIEKFTKELKENVDLQKKYKAVFQEIDNEGKKTYLKFINKNKIKTINTSKENIRLVGDIDISF
jgi:hypothetical protein